MTDAHLGCAAAGPLVCLGVLASPQPPTSGAAGPTHPRGSCSPPGQSCCTAVLPADTSATQAQAACLLEYRKHGSCFVPCDQAILFGQTHQPALTLQHVGLTAWVGNAGVSQQGQMCPVGNLSRARGYYGTLLSVPLAPWPPPFFSPSVLFLSSVSPAHSPISVGCPCPPLPPSLPIPAGTSSKPPPPPRPPRAPTSRTAQHSPRGHCWASGGCRA